MALRRSGTGQRVVDAGSGTGADAALEAHLPKLALLCLRLTNDPEKAVLLAERVLLEARRRIASTRRARGSSALLFSVLREQCATAVRPKSAPAALNPLRAVGEIP